MLYPMLVLYHPWAPVGTLGMLQSSRLSQCSAAGPSPGAVLQEFHPLEATGHPHQKTTASRGQNGDSFSTHPTQFQSLCLSVFLFLFLSVSLSTSRPMNSWEIQFCSFRTTAFKQNSVNSPLEQKMLYLQNGKFTSLLSYGCDVM